MSSTPLLPLVLLLVIGVVVLVAFLLRRSQSSGPTYGSTPGSPPPSAPVPPAPTPGEAPESTDADEEYAGSGLSAFPDADDQAADGEISGTPPPAELLEEPGPVDEPVVDEPLYEEPAIDEPAPDFDDGAADSTPLYRTLRDRLDGTIADPEGSEVVEDTVVVEDAATDAVEPDFAGPDPATRKEDEPMSTQQTEEVLGDVENAGVDVAVIEEDGADPFPVVRVSDLHEVVDGGFGIGSAAPIADGAQPLGHPIKANIDTKTYQDLHSPWYAHTQPDVWFLDVGFAERAGFHRAE